ncbi:hypothetical protein GOODEAATRI_014668, partial [Goodea atripinnis]
LMQNLADIIMGTVQYNEEGVLMSIMELCGVMTDESEEKEAEMEAYNHLVKLSQEIENHVARWLRTAAQEKMNNRGELL